MNKNQIEAQSSLERIQNFDANSLVQKRKLGDYSFEGAVEPARRLQVLYNKIPQKVVEELSATMAKKLLDACNATFSRFDEILSFDLDQGSVTSRREALTTQLADAYDLAFDQVAPIIAFAVADTTDFTKLEERGRAAVQSLIDETEQKKDTIDQTLTSATELLEEVRNVAAEEGVLKQAKFFKDEAESHADHSVRWLVASVIAAILVVFFVGWTLLYAKAPLFASSTTYEAIQIAVSKILFFSVLTYLLVSCVRMYRSHLHNSVVNKHRQNALMTYRTLSESGATPEARDTILNHAAAAIYAPVDSGYVLNEERGYGASLPAVSLTPKAMSAGE